MECPNRLIIKSAMRLPSPDFTTALAIKNATSINKIKPSEKPEKASSGGKVPVKIVIANAKMEAGKTLKALKTTLKIVVIKMANKCHSCGPSSAGLGENHRAMPKAMMSIRLIN